MATIFDLAQMSDNVYNGTSSATQNVALNGPLLKGLTNWTVFDNSNSNPKAKFWNDGYFGVAYRNTVTGEIVIANRGTSPTPFSDPVTFFKNLASDAALGLGKRLNVQDDAAAFAQQVVKKLQGTPFTSLIETGHSLGGTEAQAAVAFLIDNGVVPRSQVSGVLFNSPGIGGFHANSAANLYNVVDLYDQGDAIHRAGGTHLGGSSNLLQMPAGPDTTRLALLTPVAIAAGPAGILALLATALYDVVGPAHAMTTIVPYLNPGVPLGAGSATGAFNWSSGANPALIPGTTAGAPSVYSFDSNAHLVLTDPASGVAATFSFSPDGQTISAIFSGGSSAVALALDSLGTVSVPTSELSQSLSSITGASLLTESIIRNANNAFDVTFQNGGTPSPNASDQFVVTASNASSVFSYAVPGATQTIVEFIDNGVDNSTGSVVVLGSSATTLTGGSAVAGQSDTWVDTLTGTQYSFAPAAPSSSEGILTISQGPLGPTGNEIVIDHFNLATAHSAAGYLGIILPETLSLNATANAGSNSPTPNFIAGSSQSYTLSVDAPSTTAQSITVTLAGASASDFNVFVGNSLIAQNGGGSFNIVLAAGQTNVAFTLKDVTPADGSSDIATGATLQLTASLPNLANPSGLALQSTPIIFSYIPGATDTSTAPMPTNTITGTYDNVALITTYVGDGGNDFIAAATPNDYIAATNSGNDIIIGGTGKDTIYGGSGNDVTTLKGAADYLSLGNGFNTVIGGAGKDSIYSNNATAIIIANSGSDVIIGGDGTNEIYAGAKMSLADAIAAASTATATGQKGDLIAVGDGNNTIIGSNGNDYITSDDPFHSGGGNDVIVLGAGNDTYYGGTAVTSATGDWTASIDSNNVLNTTNVYGSLTDYTNPYAQPYNGNSYVDASGNTTQPLGAANVTIFGGTGNYHLILGNGNNYVEMGSGNSSVSGGMGNDTILAGSGSDTIRGGGGTTYIVGGSGTEHIAGGVGNNTIIGGSGNATIYSSYSASGSINFANANLTQNYVNGGSGNDLIYGSAGHDTLIAGSGNTTIYGQTGASEYIVGGSGNDFLVGGTGNDTIVAGGSGIDTLWANGSSSTTSVVYGGNGKDAIVGGSGINFLYAGDGGTAGAATTVSTSQTDSTATTTIYGGRGVDLLQGGAGSSVIYGGDGGTATGYTTLVASTGNATLYGGLGTDFLQGGSGTDVLYAGDGGTSTAPTTVSGGTGVASLYGGAGPSLMQDLQSGHDLLVSGTANDTLLGIGSDTLVAGSGNDFLQANSGSVNVEFNAGFGNDTVFANGGTENLLLGSGLLTTDFTGSVGFDSFGNSYLNLTGDGGSISLENALTGALASAAYVGASSIPLITLLTNVLGGDQTVASGSNNFMVNLANNISVSAGLYYDTISSWGNNSTLSGGAGYYPDIIYSAGTAARITSSAVAYDTINAAGNNDTITGGTYGDVITVSGANSIVTLAPTVVVTTSVVTASGANDTLVAGPSSSNVNFVVINASAVIQVTAGTGIDTVTASVSYTAPTNVNILTLTGTGNIIGTGNAANDTLTAGAGNDTLIAGSGLATLIGGSGNTTFIVNNSADTVQNNSTTTNDSMQSSVSYVLPTNVNTLVLTGTAALTGTANGGNDTLVSNSGIDTLIGGVGNDTFILNNPLDVVLDTAGIATIIYQSSLNFTLPANVNTLTLQGSSAIVATGNSGNDFITANSGTDTLIAGNGNDTLVSGLGAAIDSLVGGTGNDLFVVNNASDVVSVGSIHGVDTIQSSVSYTASANVANLTLIGTSALTATGNALSNVLTANSGNDTLVAGAGVATLIGGSGNDTFIVNSANDVIQNASAVTNNTLQSSVSNTLMANVNTLVLTGVGNLMGMANSANDTLISNTGVDTLVGGAGNDTFVISNANDLVQDTSTSATNSILSSVSYTLPTNVNAITLTGTAALVATGNLGNDLLIANSGADTLIAGNGNDTLVSGSSTQVNSLVGGTGNDLFIVNYASDVVSVGAAHGADTLQSSVSFTLPTNVNTLTLTGSANLIGAAVSGSNSITGNAGNDVLIAGSGNDTLVAGSGIDTLMGGAGSDTFVINNVADVLQSLSSVGNRVLSSVNYTMPTNVVALILTGTANLQATGNAQTDQITANAGNDTLTAGTGVATFFSGYGNDVFVVNNSSDQVVGSSSGLKYGVDTIQSSVNYSLSSSVNNLLLTGNANLSGTGNNTGTKNSGDLIVGNAGLDTLIAGIGTDTLIAGTGLATLVGSSGNDTFVVNNIGDVVQDSVSGFNNSLVSSVSYTLPVNVNTLTLTGSANLVAMGNSANDSMTGNSGADLLIAGVGNDTLVSGSGIDTLVGGAGTDVFVINNAADIVQSASTSSGNTLYSSVSYVLPTNVNKLTLTGVANISGTGNGAVNTLIGGAGNDTLTAGVGVATLIGGLGNTTFVVNNSGDVVQDTFGSRSNTIQSSVSYTLVSNVNTLVLTGTTALLGSANSANDTLTSNTGIDTLVGGSGNDLFVINNVGDIVQDTSTTATNMAQSSVNYALAANVNTLVLAGTAALQGTANSGSDTLVSNSGVDTLVGGSGNDTFVVNNALDVVQDTFAATTNLIQSSVSFTLPTNVNALTLTGTAALSATGNAANNVIRANSGRDTLSAGSGVATLIGGTGNDTFVVNNALDVVQDTSTTASNTLQSTISTTLMANVNTLVLTGTGNLTGTANAGTDTLTSNTGIDTLIGGAGNDLFVVNNSADVILNATSNDTIESSVSFTFPANISNLILIGSANLSGTGNASSNTLTAGAGVDTLIAGSGVATLIGGTGNDTFVVNNASDVVQDSFVTTNNTIQSSVSFLLPTNVDALTLTGAANLTAIGNSDATNVLTANSGNDLLVGTALSNTIYGGAGSDTIDAGPEANLIYAGSGGTAARPTYIYGNASGTNTTTQTTIYAGGGTDVIYGGPGSDLIYGGTGTDSIYAGTGFDSMYGTAGSIIVDSLGGHDLLVAGGGAETLAGMSADTLVAGSGADLLYDTIASVASTTYEFTPGFGNDTIGIGGSTNGTLYFASGITPSMVTPSLALLSNNASLNDVALVLNDGTGSVVIAGGLVPGTINAVNFQSSGPGTLAQFMNAYAPASLIITDNTNTKEFVSSGNSQTITDPGNEGAIFAFGSSDVITSSLNLTPQIFAYGNNDTITGLGSPVWAGGSGDVINTDGGATLVGSNDTVIAGTSSANFVVYQGSSVIQVAAGSGIDSIDSFASYTLPSHVQFLTLDRAVDGLSAASNAQGGVLTAAGNADTLTGGSGADTLSATGLRDVLVGGSGSETYVLQSTTDSIIFGTGAASLNSVQTNFTYALTSAANTLIIGGNSANGTANSANDRLTATGSNDSLTAGTGNDTLVDAANSPVTMIGGTGNDTFVVTNSGDVISDSSTTANNTIQTSVNFALPTNVNALTVLGSNNVTVTANSANDTLVAGTGVDTFAFNSGFGHDLIQNANSGDVIQFGAGILQSNLTITALPGTGGAAPSLVISGAGGAVTVQGGLVPGAISSVKFGDGSSSTVAQLVAPTGRATIAGSSGNLILSSNNGDSIVGGVGQDTIIAWGNNDTLTAGSGGTVIFAGGSGDKITGGSGTDTLDAIGLATTLIGGTGNETFLVSDPSTVIQVAAGQGHDTVFSSITYTVPTNVSVLTLTGTASLQATGNAGSDTITANSGNDTLIAGTGVATLVGGSGSDTFIVNNVADVVQDTSLTATNIIQSSVSYTLPANVNILALTAAGTAGAGNTQNDILNSFAANVTLVAGSGADTLQAGGINNVLKGGSGQDVLSTGYDHTTFITGSGINSVNVGGGAYETVYINNSADTIDLLGQFNTINTSVNYTLTAGVFLGNAVNWVLTGSANLVASYQVPPYALAGPLTLHGNAGNDTLSSSGLNNTFYAGTGIDTIIGGSGGNFFYVNNVADVVVAPAGSTDTIFSSVSFSLPVNIDNLQISGPGLLGTGNSENDTLFAYGSTGAADTLLAGSGNDLLTANGTCILIAGAGIDTLRSLGYNDTLIAGSGSELLAAYDRDWVIFNSGFGNSQVNYTSVANPATIEFGAGITGSNLTASAILDVNGNGALAISNGTGTTTLDGALANQTYQFIFNGGSTLTLAQFLSQVHLVTSSVVGAFGNLIFDGTASTAVTAGTGNDTIYAAAANDTITGGSGAQVLYALGANDLITGGSASDTLSGLGTNDTLVAGAAVDTLIGGTGATVDFIINNSSDVVQLQASPGSDTLSSSASYSLPTGINTLTLTGTAALIGTANSGADTLIANGASVNTLVGGAGADLFIINSALDIVSVGTTHGVDTIQSSVSYTASANVANLMLTGTAALVGTGNTLANVITANSGADTLTAGTGIATLVGGVGNDTFVINNVSDVIQDTSITAANVLQSSVRYSLPNNVNRLILTGTAALLGTANSGADTLTANSGTDTLVSGTGIDSLVGGTGANLFIVNNASDSVTVGTTHGVDTIQSSVTYSASANVANLTLTGTAALMGTGNALAGTLTANSGADTLVAGTGIDTLVGGTGVDVFVLNSSADVVKVATSGIADTIQSSANYTLPSNVQYLMLTGTSALTGTGNTLLDLIVGNTGNDTLTGGTGIAVLEGGRTAGSDQLKALSNQAALIAGGGSSTLTGGAFKDFYAAGKVSDSITTGATANVVSINKGDGATTVAPTTGATNVLSLGAGIDTESLFFTKTGTNLILTDAVSGDSITFTNWYGGAANQTTKTLQVVEIASANYNSAGTDGLRNKALEAFNFTSLVAAYNTAGSPANWALSNAMPAAQLASTATAAYGGDLAYYFALNGNLTGVNLTAAQSTLTNTAFATATQTIDPFASITGGGGLHLSAIKPVSPNIASIASPGLFTDSPTSTVPPATDAAIHPQSPRVRIRVSIPDTRRGIEDPTYRPMPSRVYADYRPYEATEPVIKVTSATRPITSRSYVDPINVAWLTLHGALDERRTVRIGGTESIAEHEEIAVGALLGSAPLSAMRRRIEDPELGSRLARHRAL